MGRKTKYRKSDQRLVRRNRQQISKIHEAKNRRFDKTYCSENISYGKMFSIMFTRGFCFGRYTILWLSALHLSLSGVRAQSAVPEKPSVIKVHFLYGSKPKKAFRLVEKKWFGGIHGGHVSLEVGNEVIGFEPQGKFHVFGHRKNCHSRFDSKPILQWMEDSAGMKYTSIAIPITATQYQQLTEIHQKYRLQTPYDYAFFGMRCAAATYEILSQLDLLPPRNRHRLVVRYFYPKRLRKKLLKIADKRHYAVHRQAGRPTRKWEKE